MLELNNLTVNKGGKDIFSGLHLKIEPGEHLLIKGKSGSGKSTLLKSILLFETPSSGKVYFNGREVEANWIHEFRANFAYIGQKAPHFDGSVAEFLDLPFQFKANAALSKPTQNALEVLFTALSFSHPPLAKNYNQLSGGEQQRVSIIQALLTDRPIYLLDEITASLDPQNIARVIQLFKSLAQKTLVIVSHDREWIEASTRTYMIGKEADK